jgi:hypothetical protein
MNQQLPKHILQDLVRGASKIYHNAIYGSLVLDEQIPAETISKRMSEYVEENIPDEYRSIKVNIEFYDEE